MSIFNADDPKLGDAFSCDAIEHLIIPSSREIGNFAVRRALPTAKRRMVGPFIFFDRMGPSIIESGSGLDVAPHPHIGLSTVTYLFDGQIRHRDSLGSEMVIRPGDVNLMTAGRGIVHSERSPEEDRTHPLELSGLQTWVALPEAHEEDAPSFSHTGDGELPRYSGEGIDLNLVIGSFSGLKSPVPMLSETIYADLHLAAGAKFPFDPQWEERALYILEGSVDIAGDVFGPEQLLIFRPEDAISLKAAPQGVRVMIFGGDSMGSKRHIWWNFVSSSKERIEQAKEEWKTGRFDIVPGDEEDFVPLPG